MEDHESSLNYQLPNNALHFNVYMHKIVENSHHLAGHSPFTSLTAAATATAAPPLAITKPMTTAVPVAITTSLASDSNTPLDVHKLQVTTSELLQKLSASIFNTLQLQGVASGRTHHDISTSIFRNNPIINGTNAAIVSNGMDVDFPSNQIVIDSSSFDAMDELQKQLAYDKLMNDVWIGVVLTLILISMVFCVCSCFLYHQFRTWKRNYHSTVIQTSTSAASTNSIKLQAGVLEDPVPEYTLVSGLPSYDAALELLKNNPQSCLLVHPSVFNVFNLNEKEATKKNANGAAIGLTAQPITSSLSQLSSIIEVTTPLLSATTIPAISLTSNDDDTTEDSTTNCAVTIANAVREATGLRKILPSYTEACNDIKMLPTTENNIPIEYASANILPTSTATTVELNTIIPPIADTTRASGYVAEKSATVGFLNSLLSRK